MVFQNSDGISFSNVVLMGQGASGPVTIDGLSLVVDGRGITIASLRDGERSIQWQNISSFLWGSQVMLPDGRNAWALDVFSASGSTKFLVPADSISAENVASIGEALNSMKNYYVPAVSQPQYPIMQPPTMQPPMQNPPAIPPMMQPPQPSSAQQPPTILPPMPQPLTMQPPTLPSMQPPAMQPASYSPAPGYAPPSFSGISKHKNARRVPSKSFIIALVILIVLGGGGIGGWYLTRSGRSSNTASSQTPSLAPSSRAPASTSHTPSTSLPPDVHLSGTQLHDIAQSANIVLSDFPSTWRVCGSSCNSSNSSDQPSKAQQAQEKSQFAACLGVPVAQLNGIADGVNPPGTVSTTSQTFTAGPAGNGMVQADSQVQILPNDQYVAEQLSFLENPKYPVCLQKIVIVQAAIGSSPGSVTDPSPAYAMPLPIVPGVKGIQMMIPVDVNIKSNGVAAVIPFYTQVAFIALGRFESELMIQIPDVQAPFFGSIVTVMEHRLVSANHDLSDGHVPPVTVPPSSSSGGKTLLS